MANGSSTPNLNIPKGSVCVQVKLIDICSISNVGTKSLFTPTVPAFDKISSAPSWIFLLEHPSGKKVLFDLGIRRDWDNLHSVVAERLQLGTHTIEVKKDIDKYLDECGVGKENIDAVVWRFVTLYHGVIIVTDHAGTVMLIGTTWAICRCLTARPIWSWGLGSRSSF